MITLFYDLHPINSFAYVLKLKVRHWISKYCFQTSHISEDNFKVCLFFLSIVKCPQLQQTLSVIYLLPFDAILNNEYSSNFTTIYIKRIKLKLHNLHESFFFVLVDLQQYTAIEGLNYELFVLLDHNAEKFIMEKTKCPYFDILSLNPLFLNKNYILYTIGT